MFKTRFRTPRCQKNYNIQKLGGGGVCKSLIGKYQKFFQVLIENLHVNPLKCNFLLNLVNLLGQNKHFQQFFVNFRNYCPISWMGNKCKGNWKMNDQFKGHSKMNDLWIAILPLILINSSIAPARHIVPARHIRLAPPMFLAGTMCLAGSVACNYPLILELWLISLIRNVKNTKKIGFNGLWLAILPP